MVTQVDEIVAIPVAGTRPRLALCAENCVALGVIGNQHSDQFLPQALAFEKLLHGRIGEFSRRQLPLKLINGNLQQGVDLFQRGGDIALENLSQRFYRLPRRILKVLLAIYQIGSNQPANAEIDDQPAASQLPTERARRKTLCRNAVQQVLGHVYSLFQVLNLFAHLLDQQFEVHCCL